MNKKSIQQIKMLFTLLFAMGLSVSPWIGYAQTARVTIDLNKVPLEQVMNEIEKQTSYLFIYNEKLDLKQVVTCLLYTSPSPRD